MNFNYFSDIFQIFLNCFPPIDDDVGKKGTAWTASLQQSRDTYSRVKSRHIFDPSFDSDASRGGAGDVTLENPLSQNEKVNLTSVVEGIEHSCDEFFMK